MLETQEKDIGTESVSDLSIESIISIDIDSMEGFHEEDNITESLKPKRKNWCLIIFLLTIIVFIGFFFLISYNQIKKFNEFSTPFVDNFPANNDDSPLFLDIDNDDLEEVII